MFCLMLIGFSLDEVACDGIGSKAVKIRHFQIYKVPEEYAEAS